MTKLTIVHMIPDNKAYIFTSGDLTFIRNLLQSLKCADEKSTAAAVSNTMRDILELPNKEKFRIKTRVISVDPANYSVTCKLKTLSERDILHIRRLVDHALNSSESILVCPNYIHISTPVRRKKKKTGDE